MFLRMRILVLLFIFVSAIYTHSQPVIYIASADWCGHCQVLKKRLSEKHIAYTEFKLPVPKTDSFLVNLAKHGDGLPTVFIDVNGNHIFEPGEPYIAGSAAGEGLVDIFLGNHETITPENYIIFSMTGTELIGKVNKVAINGFLHEKETNSDSLKLGIFNYRVSVNILKNFMEINYRTRNYSNPHSCSFMIKVKNNIPYYSFERKQTYNPDSLDTFIPKEVMQHLCSYLTDLNQKFH